MDDLISRQAAIDSIAELQARAASKTELNVISKAWKRLKAIPSAEVEPVKRGHWIKENRNGVEYTAVCSMCGNTEFWSEQSNYCSNCGAKMDNT